MRICGAYLISELVAYQEITKPRMVQRNNNINRWTSFPFVGGVLSCRRDVAVVTDEFEQVGPRGPGFYASVEQRTRLRVHDILVYWLPRWPVGRKHLKFCCFMLAYFSTSLNGVYWRRYLIVNRTPGFRNNCVDWLQSMKVTGESVWCPLTYLLLRIWSRLRETAKKWSNAVSNNKNVRRIPVCCIHAYTQWTTKNVTLYFRL